MTTNTVTYTTTEISLAKLTPSPANVRRTGVGAGIEALASSIQAHGLLQSLVVRPKLDKEGQATERYEVVAGARRLAALKLLAKGKRIAKGTAIPCRVLDEGGVDGSEASLAENVVRVDMHPADQFEAFARLHDGGMGIEDIAARFGMSAHTVRQRLRLAVVSPALVQAYRDEELTLDHLTAFAVTEDQAAQERVFGQLQAWQRTPDTIRRLLTHALVPAIDRRALFVGLDAYTAAGGTVQRDLFSEDRGGWITDAALLEQLVAERMESAAVAIRAEGWKWVGIGTDAQADAWNLRRVWPSKVALSPEDEQRRDELASRYDELAEEHNRSADDLPEDVAAELDRIEAELAALDAKQEVFRPENVARAGVVFTLAVDGSLRAERGYVRPEDEAQPDPETLDEDGSEAEGNGGNGNGRHGRAADRRRHRDAIPAQPGAGGQGPCPFRYAAGRVGGAPHGGAASHHCRAARVGLAGHAARAGDGRLLSAVWGDGRGLPLLSPCPRSRVPRHRRQSGSAGHGGGRGRMAHPAAAGARGVVGMAAGSGHGGAAGLAGRVRGAHSQCREPDLDHAGGQPVHRRPGGDSGGAGYAAVLDGDQGGLSGPGAEGVDPGRSARERRGERGRAHRRQQKGGHGGGRGAVAGRQGMAARRAARSGNDISRGLW